MLSCKKSAKQGDTRNAHFSESNKIKKVTIIPVLMIVNLKRC